ncbi:hypothetical protein Q8791_30595 [Nocardiopsis sp. CT-R113]|uniref:Uncharacterized protein n=1 Tax=Nocardiopsis codii TaxID=3065942 RepID=A0ABU7KI27_9ACTN|nr:hypothetical protein [Nocardiopsis sp. CT-R113]MEE2041579.1 hypothetical protein [Nocardiopsis sp. CT-R113]
MSDRFRGLRTGRTAPLIGSIPADVVRYAAGWRCGPRLRAR